MNYIKEAESELRCYDELNKSVARIENELQLINRELTNVKSMNYDAVPGGNNPYPDDRIVNLIFKKQEKEDALSLTHDKLRHIDDILESLGEDGVILRRTYINGEMYFKIYNDLNMSERTFYNRKAEAVRRFSIQLFGIKAVI